MTYSYENLHLIYMKPLFILFILLASACTPSLNIRVEKPSIVSAQPIIEGFSSDQQALYNAFISHDEVTIDSLIKKVNLHVKSKNNETFTYAVLFSTIDDLRRVLKAGAPVDQPNSFGVTPLRFAVSTSAYDQVEMLIKAGANVNNTDNFQTPIFFEALSTHDMKMIKLLMKYNFDPNKNGFLDKKWTDFRFAEKEMNEYISKKNKKALPNK